jgi:hypothetical protein
MPPRSAAHGAQSFPLSEHRGPNPPLPIKPRTLSGAHPYCSFASPPHLLSLLNHADEPHLFPGQQSPRNIAGVGVDGEAFGRRRPPLSALSLHPSPPLLGLDLTLHPIPSLAEQGRRHLRWDLRIIADEHGRTHHLEPFFLQDSDAEEIRRDRRHSAAAQPPSTPLGEHRSRTPSS